MSESVPSVSTFDIGLASGCLGAGVGYVLAPRKYDLEQLITLPNDIFVKSIPKSVINKQNETKKNSYNAILEARDIFVKAVENNTGEVKLADLRKKSSLQSAYKEIKSFIPKARMQAAIAVGVLSAFGTMALSYITSPRN